MTVDLLLHVCCAPDATVPWPALTEEGYHVAGYFYSSNIHPRNEFERRAWYVRALAGEMGGSCIIAPYEPAGWLRAVRDDILEPEGGARCTRCIREQILSTAREALARGIGSISTTLTISPHKNVSVIEKAGEEICRDLGLKWVFRVWRKHGGVRLSVERSSRMGFFRQNYCGCVMSIRNQ